MQKNEIGLQCRTLLNIRTRERCEGNLIYHPHYLNQIAKRKIVRLTHLCDNPNCSKHYLCRCGKEFGTHVDIAQLEIEEKEYQEKLKANNKI